MSIDFVSHGTKLTGDMIEHPFSISQVSSNVDPNNVSLSGFSMQNDMLTSAYFNSEVGDLREILAGYQIKLDNKNKKHRAIFLGGMNNRDGNSKVPVDVNVGNYPLDVIETDTNTGKSWKDGLGIPNIPLKGNSFKSKMPIYPLTEQNPDINGISSTILEEFSTISSFIDAIELLKNVFGLSTLNYNINNVKYINNLGNTITNSDFITPNASNTYTPLNKNIYVSMTSSVTQWVKLAGIKITITGIETENYSGLVNNSNQALNITAISGFSVKLIVDGFYCPRQMIGNGMSHQQLFVWNEGQMGDNSNEMITINSLLQFDLSNYLIVNDLSHPEIYSVTKVASNKVSLDFGTSTVPTNSQYIYLKKEGSSRGYIYKIVNSVTSGTTTTITLNYSVPDTGNYQVKVLDSLSLYQCSRFNIDEIRDRYSMLQLISHLGRIYNTSVGMSLPLKLVEYLAQIKRTNTLTILLKYIELCQLYQNNNSSTVDSGKQLNQIFNLIENDENYMSYSDGGNYGVSIKYWDDKTDSVVLNEGSRFTCINTNTEIVIPADWNTSTNKSPSGLIKSLNTNRINKVKHIVVTNLPGFTNGRYGTSMSSSNLVNGFFGSLSIDLSYSDTHTPVDINGMTVHQWDIGNTTKLIDGVNNPSKWNVNADENYMKEIANAQLNE